MKPVDQTIFGRPSGNCLPACVASLLELSIEDVPNFCDEADEVESLSWWVKLSDWLGDRGLWALLLQGGDPRVLLGYTIVSGMSPRGLLHSTVWRHGRMVHDPHPSRAGIEDVEDAIVLVPLDLGRWRRA